MATATVTFTDQQLEKQLQNLHADAAVARKRLDDDQRKLDAANSEQARIREKIAGGTADASALHKFRDEAETLTIRVEGHKKHLTTIQTETGNLQEELRRRQDAATLAARRKELAAAVAEGEALAGKIWDELVILCTKDLRAFEEIRGRLLTAYMDIGGQEAAAKLREHLFQPAGPNEKVRSPEKHLAFLDGMGYVPFGFDAIAPSNLAASARLVSNSMTILSVVAARPKEK